LDKNSDNLAVVKYGENLKPGCHVDVECNEDLIEVVMKRVLIW